MIVRIENPITRYSETTIFDSRCAGGAGCTSPSCSNSFHLPSGAGAAAGAIAGAGGGIAVIGGRPMTVTACAIGFAGCAGGGIYGTGTGHATAPPVGRW